MEFWHSIIATGAVGVIGAGPFAPARAPRGVPRHLAQVVHLRQVCERTKGGIGTADLLNVPDELAAHFEGHD
jgi:hypothetical protein